MDRSDTRTHDTSDQVTQRVGLIGYPVEHSLSPAFQQAAFDALGIDAVYELWPTPPEQLAARVAGLRRPDVFGANVTVPYKTRAFELVDASSEIARRDTNGASCRPPCRWSCWARAARRARSSWR